MLLFQNIGATGLRNCERLKKQNEYILLNNTFEKTVAFLHFEICTWIYCSGVIFPMHVYPAYFILAVQITCVDFY